MIAVVYRFGNFKEKLKKFYDEVTEVKVSNYEYCPDYRRPTIIYLARKPKVELKSVWEKFKFYY